jgi:hypothetical protein
MKLHWDDLLNEMSNVPTAYHAPWTIVCPLLFSVARRSFGSLRRTFTTMVMFELRMRNEIVPLAPYTKFRTLHETRGRTPKGRASVPDILAFNPIPLMLVPIRRFTG